MEHIKLDRPQTAISLASKLVTDWNKEFVIGMYVDSSLHLIHAEVISMGTLNMSLSHPREVFKPAVLRSAASVLLLHNHPSDDLKPSDFDKKGAKQLVKAGEILGIPFQESFIFNKYGAWFGIISKQSGK